MVDHKVLITTSGIGSRLGEVSDFTNKSLVRVGDKPAISHIVEFYPKETSFVVTLGHFGTYVKQYLELVYPDRDFTFVEVDVYDGPDSSLGYSILQAEAKLRCPFVFHACDTILTESEKLPNLDDNWCAGAHKVDASQYRTLKINGDSVEIINEKGEMNFDYSYIGLCGIKDYKVFWEQLHKLPNSRELSDVHVINEMIEAINFKFHKINNWLDIGNITQLKEAREYFDSDIKVLDKKDESIYIFDDSVVKFFSNEKINKNRVTRASHLKGLVPEMLGSTANFYKYTKAEGKLFAECANESRFKTFLKWASDNLWTPLESDNFNEKCFDFYINKSKKRIDQYLEGGRDIPTVINGEEIPSVEEIFSKIDTEWLCNGTPVRFHGDFILDNVIKTREGFCLIDWRQDFAGDLEVGDIYYDLAKLNHNLIVSHGIVDQGLFDAAIVNCHVLCNSTLLRCRDILHSFIKDNGFDLKKVEVLSSIIWINMAPLHEYPFNRFLFNFGKYNLYKRI